MATDALHYQRQPLPPIESIIDRPVTSKNVDLLTRFMKEDPPNSDIINNFDIFFDTNVALILAKLIFYVTGSNQQRVIVPSHVMISKPVMCSDSGKTVPLFPAMARKTDQNYSARIYAYLTEYHIEDYEELLRNPEATVDIISQSLTPTVIGELPVMIRSKYCHLNGLNDEQLSERAEMVGNPGGYFIVAGNEYFIRIIEMCRANHPLIFNRKANMGGPSCSMTSVDMIGASVVTNIVRGKNAQGMIIIGPTLRGVNRTSDEAKKRHVVTNFIPVIAAMALVYDFPEMSDFNTIINTMRTMTNEENWKVISNLLSSTIIDSHYYMNSDRELLTFVLKQFAGELDPELLQLDDNVVILLKNALRGYMDTYILGIQGLTARERIYTVLFLVVVYAEYLGELRPLTDRDGWEYKRFKNAADDYTRSYQRILLSEYQRIFRDSGKSTRRTYRRDEAPPTEQTKPAYRDFLTVGDVNTHWRKTGEGACGGSVTNTFARQFKIGSWGRGPNIVSQLLDNLPNSPLGALARIRQMFVTTESKAMVTKARSIKMSQLAYGSPTTPMNQNCGLTKSAGQTMKITHDVPSSHILNIINNIKEGHAGYLYIDPQPNTARIMVNGIVRGWANAIQLRAYLIGLRRQYRVHKHTAIYLDKYNNMFIHTDKGRCVRPLLVLDSDRRLVIDVNNWWDKDIGFLLSNGAMEYIDSMEIQSYRVATLIKRVQEQKDKIVRYEQEAADLINSIQDKRTEIENAMSSSEDDEAIIELEKELIFLKSSHEVVLNKIDQLNRPENQYNYCEIHPSVQLDIIAATIPLLAHSQSSKIIGQANMMPQATTGETTSSSTYRGGQTHIASKIVVPPLVTTMTDRQHQPYGMNLFMGFGTFGGHTIEDAFIMNEASVQKLGIFSQHTISVLIPTTSGVRGENVILTLGKPNINIMEASKRDKFRWLEDNGLPLINAPLKAGDVVVGIIKSTGGIGSTEDNSRTIKPGEEGTVWRLHVGESKRKRGIVMVVSVTIRRYSVPIEGYKFTPRNGQKGTIGKILPTHLMPRTANGSVPDIFVNTHCIKRMTDNYVLELLLSIQAVFQGRPIDASPMEEFDLQRVIDKLTELGFDNAGYETLYIPKEVNGKIEYVAMDTETYVGYAYQTTMKHITENAYRVRADGPKDPSTRQGAKTGSKAAFKMNRHDQAITDHDIRLKELIKSIMIGDSDACWGSFCAKCGTVGTSNLGCVGPSCVRCQAGPDTMKKINHPFSLIRIIQFLSVAGISMKIGEKATEIVDEPVDIPEEEEEVEGEKGDDNVDYEDIDNDIASDEENDPDMVLDSGSEGDDSDLEDPDYNSDDDDGYASV